MIRITSEPQSLTARSFAVSPALPISWPHFLSDDVACVPPLSRNFVFMITLIHITLHGITVLS